jgi:ferredoxin like protein
MSSGREEKPMRVDDLLQRNVWDVDHRPHIEVDAEKCLECESKPCLLACPAGCYILVGNRVVFSYEGCLECGTCRLVCPHGAVKWSYPLSGKGVHYRFS